MGYGSAGTPPWVDEENIDREKAAATIKALEKENAALKKRIKQLEEELKKLKVNLRFFPLTVLSLVKQLLLQFFAHYVGRFAVLFCRLFKAGFTLTRLSVGFGVSVL